ncbi:MAG: Nif3-like dinuclear metal center hexameric protein [Candidatus Hydrogenedentes bacterium]|nr:Nif3-like dinuclear metal center hexameric protein [Candidatus Hydrogenedentota bacterium]
MAGREKTLRRVYQVQDIIAAMERWAPAALAYEWDRAGLHTGAPDDTVKKVVACLTVTEAVLAAARKAQAEMIVSHHPLIWEPLRTLRTDQPQARLCVELAAAGIACFSAHTSLDVAPGGVNALLAAKLGLEQPRVLFPAPQGAQVKLVTFVPESHLRAVRDAMAAAGAGVIGEYTYCSFFAPGTGTFLPSAKAVPFSGQKGKVNEEPELRLEMLTPKAWLGDVLKAMRSAHPYEEPAYDIVTLENRDTSIGLGMRGELPKGMTLAALAREVCQALEVSHVRIVDDPKRRVQRVGVLGGSGGGEIAKLPQDLDVYVTGDVRYHDAWEAVARGIAVIDAGHGGTEKFIAPAIADYLSRELPGLRTRAIIEPDLFRPVLRQE